MISKPCEECGNTEYMVFTSMNLLQCNKCDLQRVWKLKEGAVPMFANNRMKTDAEKD